MEWLMIIAFIVVSIMDSKKKSDQAKQQREQRQRMQGQPVYRSENGSIPEREARRETVGTRPAASSRHTQRRQPQKSGSLFESFTEWMDDLEKMLDTDETTAKPSEGHQPVSQNAPARKKSQKAAAGTQKKSPAVLPTKTLMEQRPDREQREAHTKVTVSVKPLTASVKPLKNAFENDEQCEHRIELNPNIQYSKQKQNRDVQAAAIVKTDSESLVQGIIWSEILGKPKAYQPNEPKFRRR